MQHSLHELPYESIWPPTSPSDLCMASNTSQLLTLPAYLRNWCLNPTDAKSVSIKGNKAHKGVHLHLPTTSFVTLMLRKLPF